MNLKFTISICLFFVFFKIHAQESILVDEILAKVDDYIVLKSDLETAYLEFLSQGEFIAGDVKCHILENLVINKLMLAKARIDSIVVSSEQVNSNLRRRMDYMISRLGSEEEIEKYYGKSLEQIEDELYQDMKDQMTIQKMQEEITSKVKVTPIEVKKFFDNIPQDSLPYFSAEVSVAQIVIKPKPNEEQENTIKQKLNDIRQSIIEGESFADLARIYSEDPGSGANGGELPFFNRGQLDPEYEAAVLTTERGEITKPIRSSFGYHIIQMIEKRGNLFKSRHILIKVRPSSDDIEKAKLKIDSIRTLIINDSITFRNAAKLYSEDKSTSSNGGFFSDNAGNNYVSVETLDPNIFFTIDTMNIGTISKPIKFTTEDGSTAYRIIFLENKIKPHQANYRDDYQKIYVAAQNSKKSKFLDDWFKKMRDNIFIEISPDFEHCNINK